MAENVSITNLPAATEVKSGDFIILETSDGTQIIDYKDFIIGKDNVTFWPRLSGNTTDIKTLSTTQTSLSSELASFRTTVSDVSGLSGIVWKDTWNSATTYKISQAVAYNNSSFIALAENTNEKPVGSDGSLNTNWNYLAKAGVGDLTNKGGLLVGVGDGTSTQLNPGNSSYVLKSQGTGNQLVWAQEDTGSGRNICDKLPKFNPTTNAIDFVFHYLTTNGTVLGTGEGYSLGRGLEEQYDHQAAVPHPVTMPSDYDYSSDEHKIKDIYLGPTNAFLLSRGGHVYATGINAQGELGIGNTTAQYTFAKVTFPDAGVKIREIVISTDFHPSAYCAYFIAEGHGGAPNDGRVYAAGDNASGQLGDGTTSDRTSPVRVGTLVGVEKLWAWGGAQTAAFARLSGGDFYAWGDVQGNGYSGVHAADGSQAANVLSPVKQGTDGFKPGDATAAYGLHGVEDMVVNRGFDGSSTHYRSTFAMLTSGHIYVVGYNDAGQQLGVGDATNDVTKFELLPSISAAHTLSVHSSYTTSSAIVACSAIDHGSWNSTTMKYEGFTDKTSVSGVKLMAWGHNEDGCLGDTTEPRSRPVIMNHYLPSTLAYSVSSAICEAHSRANNAFWTYIRDVSGYYWFAGNNGYGLDTQNDLNQTSIANVTTFKKISLPCDPSEIKDFKIINHNWQTSDTKGTGMILTHNGRVFVNGSIQSTYGVGYHESIVSQHARSGWHQVQF